jgi:hypothetical protein
MYFCRYVRPIRTLGRPPLPPVQRNEAGKISCMAIVDPAPVQAADEARFMALQE